MQTFTQGERVRVSGSFTDMIAAVAADPTTVTLKIHDPAGAETSYTYAAAQVVKDAVGAYHYDLTVNTPGAWLARWVAGGALVAADEIQFTVRKSGFTSP